MDRRTWLEERRMVVEAWVDAVYAPTYDTDEVEASETHRRFVEAVIASCPPGGSILDAACGSGRYFPMILAAGRHVVGIDRSAGMLAEARSRFPTVRLAKVALQELRLEGVFDAAICVDAMENIPPEDWPVVLGNLRRSVSPGGRIYLTVEQIAERAIAAAFAQATAAGFPVVTGETLRGGGYHHYPTETRVRTWLADAGLTLVEEARTSQTTFGYWHLLVRSGTGPP